MKTINIKTRLRPIRFGFLVKPNDKKNISEIFKINTCLWGGMYNPIIPVFNRTPKWWSDSEFLKEKPKDALNRYLDFFEPDVLVECGEGLAAHSGYAENRIISLDQLLIAQNDEHRWKDFGQDVYDLYQYLYDTEYKYSHRDPHDIALIEGDTPALDMVASCIFGGFTSRENYGYYKDVFKDTFSPTELCLDANVLAEFYSKGTSSALGMANSQIKCYPNHHKDPALFVFDINKPYDLIDYWNLRAVYPKRIVPIPKNWLDELSEFCKQFIIQNYRPLPGNRNGVMIRPTAMFSRSIENEEVENLFNTYIRVEKDGANCIQNWYPSFDAKQYKGIVREQKPLLVAKEKDNEYLVSETEKLTKAEALMPEFADSYSGNHKWANVIQIRNWGRDAINTVFPIDFRNPKYPTPYMGGEITLSTTEGLVLIPRSSLGKNYIEIDSCTDAISKWLETQGISTVKSDAGRATHQIIDTLGGFWGVRALTSKKVIDGLNKIAMKPSSKTDNVNAFKNKMNSAPVNRYSATNSFQKLVDSGAVEIGAELKCAHCGHPNWFDLPKLNYSVQCNLCMKHFDFPKLDTKNSLTWAYRLIGPFALPNYAKGGYSAALSLRFFSEIVGDFNFSKISWTSGRELTYPDQKKIEADYILWVQQTSAFDVNSQARLVFGEAKSFAKEAFTAKDIQAMQELAIRHHGAVLVFSTLKNKLSDREIKRLKKLAIWGREIDRKSRVQRATVIILTGVELFTIDDLSLTDAWKKGTAKHKTLAESHTYQLKDLDVLADFTQQIYLGLESYAEWWQQKFEARRQT
ncbi:hypothetical protein [Pseudoalteromonas obscura]|uniref:Uncharacterized protein n=1 Tax=Pseudoalteromonas obscura TaxID=3048491 RepID=A0ABT7EM42_9GAMM|nr:hypothetical protein [Pseudoalteromonas sp. P94(2023)]MDK2596075.1 hypothetical protein [Pseudoalteromonas sp. P94(2023)]